MKAFNSAAKANKVIVTLIFSGKLNHSIINNKGVQSSQSGIAIKRTGQEGRLLTLP